MLTDNIKYDLEVPFAYKTFEKKTLNEDLPEVFPIRSNTILYKCVTGLGATYNEITAKRNSIIVLPYVAVIESKQKYHHEAGHDTFAVYGNVTIGEIIQYLNKGHKFKKFITTPKGVNKIISALSQIGIDYKKDYFLLIDESHKLIQDANYRDDLIDFMEDFFTFTFKAMVSATPIPPTDPRFKMQNFKNVKIYPSYEYRKAVKLIVTNSLITSLQKAITDNQSEYNCIFFNTINGIKSIVQQLHLEDDYMIHCSEESRKVLKIAGESNATSTLGDFKKFNFFTSSFFNGLDIIMPTTPNLIVLTDKSYQDHTLLDPLTDILQIVGRFRDPKLTITHIHNAEKSTYPLSEKAARNLIVQSKKVYEAVEAVKTSLADLELDPLFDQALKAISPYSSLLDKSGNYSFFLGDNFLNEIRVAKYYKSPTHLKAAYLNSNLYYLDDDFDNYAKSEIEKLKVQSVSSSPQINQFIAETLLVLDDYKGLSIYNDERREIEQLFPLIIEAFDRLGFETLFDLKFKRKFILKELLYLDISEKKNSFPMLDLIYMTFDLNRCYLSAEIKTMLQALYNRMNLNRKAKSTDLENYFYFINYTKHIDGRSNRAYIFNGRKFHTDSRTRTANRI